MAGDTGELPEDVFAPPTAAPTAATPPPSGPPPTLGSLATSTLPAGRQALSLARQYGPMAKSLWDSYGASTPGASPSATPGAPPATPGIQDIIRRLQLTPQSRYGGLGTGAGAVRPLLGQFGWNKQSAVSAVPSNTFVGGPAPNAPPMAPQLPAAANQQVSTPQQPPVAAAPAPAPVPAPAPAPAAPAASLMQPPPPAPVRPFTPPNPTLWAKMGAVKRADAGMDVGTAAKLAPLVLGGAETAADTVGQAINNPDHPWSSAERALISGLGSTAGAGLGGYVGSQYGPAAQLAGAGLGIVGGGLGGAGLARYMVPEEKKTTKKAAAPSRHLGIEEQQDVDEAQQNALPTIFQGYGTPLPEMMSSPTWSGWGGAGLGGLVGAGLGGAAGGPALAGLGGLAGAGLGGLMGYHGRKAHNQGIVDLMKRLPPGATRRDYLADTAVSGDLNRATWAGMGHDIGGGLAGLRGHDKYGSASHIPYPPYSSATAYLAKLAQPTGLAQAAPGAVVPGRAIHPLAAQAQAQNPVLRPRGVPAPQPRPLDTPSAALGVPGRIGGATPGLGGLTSPGSPGGLGLSSWIKSSKVRLDRLEKLGTQPQPGQQRHESRSRHKDHDAPADPDDAPEGQNLQPRGGDVAVPPQRTPLIRAVLHRLMRLREHQHAFHKTADPLKVDGGDEGLPPVPADNEVSPTGAPVPPQEPAPGGDGGGGKGDKPPGPQDVNLRDSISPAQSCAACANFDGQGCQLLQMPVQPTQTCDAFAVGPAMAGIDPGTVMSDAMAAHPLDKGAMYPSPFRGGRVHEKRGDGDDLATELPAAGATPLSPSPVAPDMTATATGQPPPRMPGSGWLDSAWGHVSEHPWAYGLGGLGAMGFGLGGGLGALAASNQPVAQLSAAEKRRRLARIVEREATGKQANFEEHRTMNQYGRASLIKWALGGTGATPPEPVIPPLGGGIAAGARPVVPPLARR